MLEGSVTALLANHGCNTFNSLSPKLRLRTAVNIDGHERGGYSSMLQRNWGKSIDVARSFRDDRVLL